MIPNIITIGGIKGGVGKSLIACQLASLLAQNKQNKVLLVDGDEQKTASSFHQFRAQQDVSQFDCQGAYGLDIIKLISSKKSKYTHILIDVGGRDTESQRASLSISNLFFLPFAPSSFDLWTCEQVQDLVQEAQKVNKKLKAFSFLNKAETRKNSKDNQGALSFLKSLKGIKSLDCFVSNRKAFANASAFGLSVNELSKAQKNEKAEEEIKTLSLVLA